MIGHMPRPTSFGKDTGLQLRMALTMFLLGLVYVILVVALLGSGVNGVTVALIAGGLAAFQLFGSDKLALRAMGAREVTPAEAPELHAMIDRLCVQADLPKPKVAVADTRMPNAFALGRSPKSATVCATTGIMELLSPAELEGVMAHELTHVANRDVLVMTLAVVLRDDRRLHRPVRLPLRRRPRRRRRQPERDGAVPRLDRRLRRLVLPHAGAVALPRVRRRPRRRADHGRPSALASALTRISGGMQRIPQRDLRATQELAAFYIFPPGAGKAIGALFATHPPMEKRIAALQRLEMQLQGTA